MVFGRVVARSLASTKAKGDRELQYSLNTGTECWLDGWMEVGRAVGRWRGGSLS
jgi:hypothetical protein